MGAQPPAKLGQTEMPTALAGKPVRLSGMGPNFRK